MGRSVVSEHLVLDQSGGKVTRGCLQLVWAYVFLSGLSGMALTYYYDNEDNIKLLNILKYGLMLLGLGLVYCSTSMTEASALLCVLLLGSIPASVIWEKRYAMISSIACWRCALGLGIVALASPQVSCYLAQSLRPLCAQCQHKC